MKQLIFVYNADAGLFSQVTDFAHKVISPETYECNLCKLTYGNVTMKQDWKKFLDALPAEKVFLHRNEFAARYPNLADTALPAIFAVSDENPSLLISAGEINAMKALKDLQEHILKKISQ